MMLVFLSLGNLSVTLHSIHIHFKEAQLFFKLFFSPCFNSFFVLSPLSLLQHVVVKSILRYRCKQSI